MNAGTMAAAPSRGNRFAASDEPASGELRLQRLAHADVEHFHRQYADPAIAALCCWPEFASADAWHDWLDAVQAAPEHALFGIWHRQQGFIGCAGLVLHDGLGFFHYWLGRDFRAQGHGTRTGLALLAFAREHWGLRACYAKVFASNHVSRRSLGKIGFHDTGVPITSPAAHEEQLLRWPSNRHDAADEARRLFAALEADVHVADRPSDNSPLPDVLHLAETAASPSRPMTFEGAKTP